LPLETPSRSADDVVNQLRQVLAFVFDIDLNTICLDTRFSDLPDWSSLTFAVLMVGIQKRFGVTPDPEQASRARTVSGLARVIHSSLSRSDDDG
jgi:acyl carrier protein